METWYLVDSNNKIVDRCLHNNEYGAEHVFACRGLNTKGKSILTEADYLIEMQLSQMENQSPEC